MNLNIQAVGFELTEAIEAQAEKILTKIQQVDSQVSEVTVTMEIQKRKDDNGCTVTWQVDRPGKNVVVKEKSDDLYECLAAAGKSAVRAVRKEKEKEKEVKK